MDEVFKALGDPTRLRIVQMLAEQGEVCVCKIVEAFDMNQSVVSHHMGKLRQAGLVRRRKEGQWMHYSLNIAGLKAGPHSFLSEIIWLTESKGSNISDASKAGSVNAVSP